MSGEKWTPGPWALVEGCEAHGPYVTAGADGTYGDIADLYFMSKPAEFSVRNGGESKPIWFQPDEAHANARLIAAAPTMAKFVLARAAQGDPEAVRLAEVIRGHA